MQRLAMHMSQRITDLKNKQKFTKKYLLMLNLIVPYVSVYTQKFSDFERILNVVLTTYKS